MDNETRKDAIREQMRFLGYTFCVWAGWVLVTDLHGGEKPEVGSAVGFEDSVLTKENDHSYDTWIHRADPRSGTWPPEPSDGGAPLD